MATSIPKSPWDKPNWPHEGYTKKPEVQQVIMTLPKMFSDQFFLGFQEQIERWTPLTVGSKKIPASFPPYNVTKNEEGYKIDLAVAGFSKDDILITVENDLLTIKSKLKPLNSNAEVIHQGIAERQWTQQFVLGEFMEVVSASLKDGLLTIQIDRVVPEELKPKEIKIK